MAEEDKAVWQRLDQHGERLAKHDAEIAALRASTERLEAAIADVRGEVRDARAELKSDMARGFDRVEQAVTSLTREAMASYPPAAAREIGDTRAAEARARAWTVSLLAAVVAAAGIIVALLTMPHH